IFSVTAVLIVSFIIWGVWRPDQVSEAASIGFSWAITNAGWLLNFTMIMAIVVMAYVGFSKLGRIKLGKDDEEPEFRRFSLVAMMFGAGIGVGLFFYGPSEPLSHYITPPPHTVDGNTVEALHLAMAQSHFHWGLYTLDASALVGAAFAHFSSLRV